MEKDPKKVAKPRRQAITPWAGKVAYDDFAKAELERRGYLARELVQCGMPLTKPPIEKLSIQRKQGGITVTYQTGIDPKTGEAIGLPYGSIARLLLIWINTEAYRQRTRTIKVTSNLTHFMEEVGISYSSGKRGSARYLREQIRRLLRAQITFDRETLAKDEDREQYRLMEISRGYDLWWNFKEPTQGALFGSFIELGEAFYDAIIQSPVPIKLAHLKELRKSPLAIDFYIWASYRLYTLNHAKEKSLFLPLPVLKAQLGSSFSRTRDFQRALSAAVKKVQSVFPHLKCEVNSDGITLHAGPTPMGDKDKYADALQQPTRQSRTARALEDRQFDGDTIRMAMAAAPGWNIASLTEAYFTWIKDKPAPKNIRAHFISFCKSHAKRNR